MSLFLSAGSFSGLFVNNFMGVGRNDAWWIGYDNISADGRVRTVRVEHDSILHEVSAVFKAFDLVDHTLISKLCV